MTVTSPGDTAWVLVSAALVLLMTPGLALFYGGMVRAKSVLNMMMMSFATIAVVTVLWTLFGYSLAFGDDAGAGLVGDLSLAGLTTALDGVAVNGAVYPIPTLAFVGFQLMFAVITPALVSGAVADRARFGGWLLFVACWVTLVYFPVAHWVFDFGDAQGNGAGWLADLGVVDFAGGTAVHVNAGAAGLALALVLGRRVGWRTEAMRPHNLPMVLLGAALLWFGWFGFNAGSALSANDVAATAFLNTQAATAAAVLGWLLVERLRDGHPTTLGAASGAVAGLVAVTPACSALTPLGSLALGLVAGAVCALAVSVKYRLGYDDSLDVVAVHLVGGAVGSLLIGVLADPQAPAGVSGLLAGGGFGLLARQALGVVAVGAYSFVMALVVAKAADRLVGLRVPAGQEVSGIDVVAHAETAYDLGPMGGPRAHPATRDRPASVAAPAEAREGSLV